MWDIIHFILRSVEALLGLFCLATAFLLYPDQEGRIQSAFEDVWIRVDDYRAYSVSKHAAFMRQVATLESRLLNRIFGVRLISPKSVSVSSSLSLLAVSLLLTLNGQTIWLGVFVASVIFCVVSAYLRQVSAIVIIITILAISTWWVWRLGVDQAAFYITHVGLRLLVLLFAGFLFDIAFITVTRKMLRWAEGMTSFWTVLLVVVSNLAVAVILVGASVAALSGPPVIAQDLRTFGEVFFVVVSLTNFPAAILALLFMFLALLLLIHRLVWPLLTRTLFRMTDIGTKGRRAILTAVGIALLSASVFGGKFPELLKDILKSFGG